MGREGKALFVSENGRFWEPAGDFVGRVKSGKKSKIEEVFCGFACYPSEEVLLDARSQPDNQSPPDAARGKHQTGQAEGAGRKAVIKGRVNPCA